MERPFIRAFLLLLIIFPISLDGQNGKELFRNNCASCHKTSSQDLVGPGLKGVTKRRDMDWLIEWTKNSQKMIESGNKQAVKIYKKYDKKVMPPQDLSEKEIKAIFNFIESGGKKAATASKKKAGGKKKGKEKEVPMPISGKLTLFWYGILAVMVLCLFIPTMDGALKTLKKFRAQKNF